MCTRIMPRVARLVRPMARMMAVLAALGLLLTTLPSMALLAALGLLLTALPPMALLAALGLLLTT